MSQPRNRSLPGAATWTLAGLALLAAPAAVTAFERIDGIVLDTGGQFDDGVLRSAVIDPDGEFAYFGSTTAPGQVLKINLETFELVATTSLDSGENILSTAVIDPEGEFAYFGTGTSPGRVVKIDLQNFGRVGAITLDSGENDLLSAVIDPEGGLAYFGTDTFPGRIVQIGLQAFTPVGLSVDDKPMAADGNGVFEPGEQVEMAPAWRNDGSPNGVADGILSSFVGPGGASYGIVQGDIVYGPVPPGETESCRDSGTGCYQLEVLLDGSERPAPHWDATVDEELAAGLEAPFTHTWALHIGESFTDVPPANLFYSSIETLLHSGVTGGCTDTAYCPAGVNTRSQMPVFVLKAVEGPDYLPPACDEDGEAFADVPFDSPFCPWIEELARRDVVSGCGGDDYCPGDPVTRAQMAIFLLKTLQGGDYTPPECTDMFDDVPCPSLFADWIEDLAAREITGGCTATEYCPGDPVSRAQMAVFVTRAFELVPYGV